MNWAERATSAEIIDDPENLSAEETARVLRELEVVNRWLAPRTYAGWLQAAIRRRASTTDRPVRIVDIGSGGGDIAIRMVRWCRQRSLQTRWSLLDFSGDVCRYASARTASYPEISVVSGNVLALPFSRESFDVVTCSAFLHHFTDRQLVSILSSLAALSRHQLIVSDLHRCRLAGWSIRLLTALLSKSSAVRHDGPLSVRRGFRRNELERLFEAAGISGAEIRWVWPFRYCVRARVT